MSTGLPGADFETDREQIAAIIANRAPELSTAPTAFAGEQAGAFAQITQGIGGDVDQVGRDSPPSSESSSQGLDNWAFAPAEHVVSSAPAAGPTFRVALIDATDTIPDWVDPGEFKDANFEDGYRACVAVFNNEKISYHWDGGEPEDNLYLRGWAWVAPALESAYRAGRHDVISGLVPPTWDQLCDKIKALGLRCYIRGGEGVETALMIDGPAVYYAPEGISKAPVGKRIADVHDMNTRTFAPRLVDRAVVNHERLTEELMTVGISEYTRLLDLTRAMDTTDPLAEVVHALAVAVLAKLHKARDERGLHDHPWRLDDWADDLRAQIRTHMDKGDPRDVAAYCAFALHHGWLLASETKPIVESKFLEVRFLEGSEQVVPTHNTFFFEGLPGIRVSAENAKGLTETLMWRWGGEIAEKTKRRHTHLDQVDRDILAAKPEDRANVLLEGLQRHMEAGPAAAERHHADLRYAMGHTAHKPTSAEVEQTHADLQRLASASQPSEGPDLVATCLWELLEAIEQTDPTDTQMSKAQFRGTIRGLARRRHDLMSEAAVRESGGRVLQLASPQ